VRLIILAFSATCREDLDGASAKIKILGREASRLQEEVDLGVISLAESDKAVSTDDTLSLPMYVGPQPRATQRMHQRRARFSCQTVPGTGFPESMHRTRI